MQFDAPSDCSPFFDALDLRQHPGAAPMAHSAKSEKTHCSCLFPHGPSVSDSQSPPDVPTLKALNVGEFSRFVRSEYESRIPIVRASGAKPK
jgi:hypothetical protein